MSDPSLGGEFPGCRKKNRWEAPQERGIFRVDLGSNPPLEVHRAPRVCEISATALKNGTWEEYKETFRKKMKASEWAFDRMKEAFELVAQDETENVSIVQEIMLRSTDYLWRIIGKVGGQGGLTMCYLCPHGNSFPLEDHIWTRWLCAICGEKYDWKQPDRLSVLHTGDGF